MEQAPIFAIAVSTQVPSAGVFALNAAVVRAMFQPACLTCDAGGH